MIPVPGAVIGTPYGRRGSWWSCYPDANGNGIHTGVDYPAPVGTKVVAARPGTVHHCNHGSAFGSHQIEVTPGDGTRDFYAHLRSRVADGTRVEAGDKVGEVGTEGNVSGPHLHFERHKVASGGWSCTVVTDPQPSIDYHDKDDDDMPLNKDDKDWINKQIEESQKAVIKRLNELVGDVVDNPTKENKHNTVFASTALGMLLDRTKKK
jgi:murein DD-endopeptidase MepM/ murein hydrolase activator NlpD